jgi:fluoride ion exporter CrcB/FEX
VRTVDLARESWLRSTTYVVATLALSLAACFVGFAIS